MPTTRLAALLAVLHPDVPPEIIRKTLPEIMTSARIILKSRQRSPTPRPMLVSPDLTEVPLEP